MRFAGWLIDSFILLAAVLMLSIWSDAAGIAGSGSGADITVGYLILTSPWLYYWLFAGLKGQTPGKILVRIKVMDAHGDIPGLGHGALREPGPLCRALR
jgi:uncharacterized RDD family membrane protein YckC